MHDDVLYKMAKIKLKSDSFAILYLDPLLLKMGSSGILLIMRHETPIQPSSFFFSDLWVKSFFLIFFHLFLLASNLVLKERKRQKFLASNLASSTVQILKPEL